MSADGIDIIGDVHGYADSLRVLLTTMDYVEQGGVYRPPEGRRAIFVGDLIDGGTQNREVIDIVRSMVDEGHAQAIVGNHEFANICFATQGIDGFICDHDKYQEIFQTFLDEYPFGSNVHKDVIEWFETLPFFIEEENFTVVHAHYSQPSIDMMKRILGDEPTANLRALAEYDIDYGGCRSAIYNTVNGPTIVLPEDIDIATSEKWIPKRRVYPWMDSSVDVQTRLGLQRLSLSDDVREDLLSRIKEQEELKGAFGASASPVLFGHYSLKTLPHLASPNDVCLDFEGRLTAYRYDDGDEQNFFPEKLVSVPLDDGPG